MKKLLILIGLLGLSASLYAAAPVSTVPLKAPDVIPTKVIDVSVPTLLLDEGEWGPLESAFYDLANQDLSKVHLVVNLHIVGFGGDMILTRNVENSILAAENNGVYVNAIIDGPAISGHAYLACSANNITMVQGGSLTYHHVGGDAYIGFFSIPYKIYPNDPEITNAWDAQLALCEARGVLTPADIDTMNNGYRIVFVAKQSGIEKLVLSDWENALDVLEYVVGLAIALGVTALVARYMYRIIK